LADGNSSRQGVKELLERYANRDSRIKVKFLPVNRGTAGNSNAALSLATGEFVGFLDHDDYLAPNALYEVVKLLSTNPKADFVYTDEVLISGKGKPYCVLYRPDFSLDYFLSHPYIVHFVVIRKELIDSVGGFREEFPTSHDYDLFLRILSKTRNICHIPKVLYYWRTHPSSAGHVYKPRVMELSKIALTDFLRREGIAGSVHDTGYFNFFRVKRQIIGRPLVSIIILTKDKVEFLKRCIQSIEEKTTYRNYEVIVVDNMSESPDTKEYLEYLQTHYPNYSVIPFREPFNFSRLNNHAATYAKGQHLLFLNNDTEVISGEWLEAMLEHSQRDEVAFVGAKLLFPDGRIQHVGVVIGLLGCAEHVYKFAQSRNDIGYLGHFVSIRNWSAVTAACMMVKKAVFEELGGFDEKLKISWGDTDLCLRAIEKGYLNVFTPYAELYHYESATRGEGKPFEPDSYPEDRRYFERRWKRFISNGDPYYNPNLPLDTLDISSHVLLA